MPGDLFIRPATAADAAELLVIYAPYVAETAISFEYAVPTGDEFVSRIAAISEKYPYLAAVKGGDIVGYAYAACFKPRAAYDRSVETTIYVRRDRRGEGIGRALCLALEDALRRQNVLNLYACIAHTPRPDEYLDNSSEAFHDRLGYKKSAHFTACGYKFGRWYDVVWMEKHIGPHDADPAPFKPITEF